MVPLQSIALLRRLPIILIPAFFYVSSFLLHFCLSLARILRKHPDSVPLRVLIGHDCMVHQNFDGALEKYARSAWVSF